MRRCVIAAALCAAAGGSTADVVKLNAMKDNTLYEDSSGALSNGAGDHFFAGKTRNDEDRRGLVAFDVSGIAPGSTINGVTLTLHMSRTIVGAVDVSVHRALADWGESTSHAGGEEGGGAPAEPGDATWIHTFSPGSFWAGIGGDFDPVASATTSVGANGFYSWTGPGLVDDVQAWVDGGAGNFGWLLRSDSLPKRFDTRENPDASVRPVLTIDFTPIPAPASLAALAGLALTRRRRR